MSAATKKAFEAAAESAKSLKERPDNDTLLKMYALYKQGSEGDNAGKRPGITDPIGRRKFDAWLGEKGKGQEDAMKEYVALIKSLQ
jgi:diazepam-binding inhibitor (GABA receptor modulator, acyl-CoA-binding protein)